MLLVHTLRINDSYYESWKQGSCENEAVYVLMVDQLPPGNVLWTLSEVPITHEDRATECLQCKGTNGGERSPVVSITSSSCSFMYCCVCDSSHQRPVCVEYLVTKTIQHGDKLS